jgi:hypothetical protein
LSDRQKTKRQDTLQGMNPVTIKQNVKEIDNVRQQPTATSIIRSGRCSQQPPAEGFDSYRT